MKNDEAYETRDPKDWEKMRSLAHQDFNREIVIELQEEGIAAPSITILRGRYCIRVAITNHRSRYKDFDVLVDETLRIGHSILA